jgi:hypothetical protein
MINFKDGSIIFSGPDGEFIEIRNPNNAVIFTGTILDLKRVAAVVTYASKFYPQLRDLP